MIIAVDGAPGAGVSSFCVKLAQQLQIHEKEAVLVVFPYLQVPPMGMLFPLPAEPLQSLGEALDSAEIFEERVAGFVHSEKKWPNVGYLGYLPGEKEENYPLLTEDRVREFLRAVRALAPFVIADLSQLSQGLAGSDALAAALAQSAEKHITLVSPTLKSAVYLAGAKPAGIMLLNTPDRSAVYPAEDMEKRLGEGAYRLPFCRELAAQSVKGELALCAPPPRYAAVLNRLIGEKLI